MRRDAGGALLAAAATVMAVAGCGGGHAVTPSSTTSSTTSSITVAATARCRPVPHRNRAFAATPADALVYVKQESPSLIWETIAVRADGSGLTTTLEGEISGAHQNRFTLTRTELASLRHEIATLGPRARRSPVSRQPGFYYLIHLAGQRSLSIPGTAPTRYGALLRLLDRLMATYDC